MMRYPVSMAAFLAVMPAAAQAHSCVKPPVPHIPDGATATDLEMSDTYRQMQAYEDAINLYLDCAYAEYANAKKEGEAALARWNEASDAYRRAN